MGTTTHEAAPHTAAGSVGEVHEAPDRTGIGGFNLSSAGTGGCLRYGRLPAQYEWWTCQ
jgi:hypothetical protein